MLCAKFVKENWWIVLFVSGHLEGKIWELQVWGFFCCCHSWWCCSFAIMNGEKVKDINLFVVKGVDVEKALVGKCTKVVDEIFFWNMKHSHLKVAICFLQI